MIFEMGILSARKVGFLLAAVWIGTLCYIWLPDFIQFATKSISTSEKVNIRLLQGEQNFTRSSGDAVHVCITSDKNTVGGMVTLMNSILSNTRSEVRFHLVVDEESLDHVGLWLKSSRLRNASYEIRSFPSDLVKGKITVRAGRPELASPLNYARYFLPELFPNLKGKIVFIDDDCVVQGDIAELYKTPIKTGHLAAFSQDCVGVNKRLSHRSNIYSEFLDFTNPHIKELGFKPTACSFNTGLFLANLTEWRLHNVTRQLLHWLELNTKESIYSNSVAGGGSQPPMMIVFYSHYSSLPPMWHVRHLGLTTGSSYSRDFVKSARLLHWNGRFKPWGRKSQHSERWSKYFIPDPAGKFKVVRR